MSLQAGSRLGLYEIVGAIGAGGMGEVYRARDLKLNRDVALKVLPEAFVGDTRRLARFEREAKSLAALNHPNVAHVYDAGTSGTTSYLVMELVAGDDLSALIARGPLPLADALAIARQIAEALEAAHDAGIVHRDLKPANIKVRPDGMVKVLDFGLAKAIQNSGDSTPEQIAGTPTVTSPAVTMAGAILGTASYMSPEQARGNPVDRRSDVWAFGAVFYELLTGRRAFDGRTVTDVLGAIVRVEPQWDAVPSEVPPAIHVLLRGCLQKDRARRVADISTARFVIDGAASLSGATSATPATARRPIAVAAATALLAMLILALGWALVPSRPAPLVRYTVTPAEDQKLVQAEGVDVALSPDGSWMVYVSSGPAGGTRLLRRNLDDLDAVAIPGTDGGRAPVVSPDGRSIAFLANGAIRTVPVEGGTPFTVVTAGSPPAWSGEGTIFYSAGGVINRVSAQGGEPVAFTTPAANVLQQEIDALPDGHGLLCALNTGTPAQARIAVVGPEGGSPRVIFPGTMARYVATGHIVYATASGTLLAAPFDLRRLAVTGPAAPLAEGVAMDASAATQFAVSRSGALLYGTGPGFNSELVWVSRSGIATPIDPEWTGEISSPALSPDGRRVAVAIQRPESRDIWVAQLDRGPRLRLTVDGNRNDYPSWSPDGVSVTFASDRSGPLFDLWTKRSDGSRQPQLELDEKWALAEAVWSPDGKWFIHRTTTIMEGAGDILARRTDREMKPVPIVASRFTEVTPAISPNGRWLAYASTETGRGEIVVAPFPNAGDAKWPISVGGGSEPAWSHDGGEIFYRNGTGQLVAVRVETRGTFSVGPTTVLFSDQNYARLPTHRQYDVAPDGRFIMVRPIGAGRERRLILVRNAFRGLEPRASD
jgi:serine/threonine-protein kinase